MKTTLKSIIGVFLVLVMVGGLSSMTMKAAKTSSSRIKIVNKSSWAIDHIYFSPIDKDSWGNDILGSDEVLEPNEAITVQVDCETWDVKFVAEDGATCIAEDLDICEVEGTWTIDDVGCD
jgi:hypothetical protein